MLESLAGTGTGSYMFSTSDATNMQLSAECPAGLQCGLMARAYRLKITGTKYNVNYGGSKSKSNNCDQSETKPPTDFAVVCFIFFFCLLSPAPGR